MFRTLLISDRRLRPMAMLLIALVLAAIAVVAVAVPARAAGTVLFENSFTDRTVDGTGTVTVPTPTSGSNSACLTAAGNSATLPLLSCAAAPDSQGNGKLRLTNATANQIGAVFGGTSFPTSNGLDVTFNTYQWGGGSADGMSFVLAAVDPANPVAPTIIGPGGGSLGYSPAGSVKGLPNAFLGIGFDVFGNYSSSGFQGTGCTTQPNTGTSVPGAVVVRGPGNNLAGYCALGTTYTGLAASKVTLHATTRAASAVPVQVLINPTATSFTSATGQSAAAGTYKVIVAPIGQATRTLSGSLPTVAAGVYPSASWTAAGIPRQLAFGFVGSTGSVTDAHEASDVKVLTFNPVPELSVVSTSYSAASPAQGGPVTYTVASGVKVGADEKSPISMTQTTPTGVVPVGAYGVGWVCAAPVGQTITCTTSGSSFANGTSLPPITVVAIVTATGITAATVQNASTARASSIDANPATDDRALAGTLPSAPSGIAVVPVIGSVSGSGSVTVTGSVISAATAIEIGTAAEQTAGTPVVLLPCPGGTPAAGCFTTSGNTLTISSMPARATAAAVTVTVVTAGLAAAGTYTYASSPATPAAPTAIAGATSATATWAAPAANSSAITSYVVTAYLGTSAAATATVDGSTLSKVFAGLTPGSSYTFSVTATNAYGTSAASAKSSAVVPYTVPGAPVISAASAGDSSAVLSWSTSSTGSSPITSYFVTPYIGATAGTAQNFVGAATTQTVTGLVPGTSYTFTVTARNAAGPGSASARSAAVIPNVSPTLAFTDPPSGEVSVAYSVLLSATNGTSPFTWSIAAGSLPTGLTLGVSSGTLSGTPTVAGSFTATVQATDASGQSATRVVTIVIASLPSLAFAPTPGEVAVAFNQRPVVSGGTGPFVWTVNAGSLPAGVSMAPTTGVLSGTPTSAGSFTVTLVATDAMQQPAARTVTIVIAAVPTLTFAAPSTGRVSVTYSTEFDTTGGTAPLTWSISAGALPTGLALDPSTGRVTGTPTAIGTSSFTVGVSDANGQSASRATSIVVAAGPIVITTTANATSAEAGSIVRFTMTITNTTASAVASVSVADALASVLDDAAYNADATATSGALGYASSTLSWSGAVAGSAVVTITYSVTVNNPDVGNKVLSDHVTASTAGTNCGSGSSDTRCATSVTVPGLTIVATSDVASTTPGSVVHFSIVVTNTGQSVYSPAGLTQSLTGMLDDGTYNGDGTATSGSVSFAASSLGWTGTLAVGASATISYSVTVAGRDTGDRSLAGTVVSSSAGTPCPAAAPAPSCVTAVVVLVPALAISTSLAATTTPGQPVPFSVTIANTGQTAYPSGTVVAIALDGALDDASYSGNATVTGGGTVSFASGTLTWTGSIAVGSTVVVSATLMTSSPATGDKSLDISVLSNAPGSTCSSACVASAQVLIPGLVVIKSASASTTTPGSVVVVSITATNTGQFSFVGATFDDDLSGALDDAVYRGDAAATGGAVSRVGSTLRWSGDLAVGAAVTMTYSISVADPDTGDRLLDGAVVSTVAGANCVAGASDGRCSSPVTVLVPELRFASSTTAATTTPGSVLGFTTTVTNTGQTTYTNTVIVLDPVGALDDATYNRDGATDSGGLVLAADGTLTWTVSLAPGASATASLSFTINDPDAGNRVASISVRSSEPGSRCAATSVLAECSAASTVLVPGLTIEKTADASSVGPGATVAYTVVVTNTGETDFAAARLEDSLASVLTDATFGANAVASSGALSYSDPVLTWSGPLAVGASATISYTVVVLDPTPGDRLMVNTITSTTRGNNCPAAGTDPRCTAAVSVLVPSLTLVTTANSVTTVAGATVRYTTQVTNSGPTNYAGATVVAALGGALDDGDYAGDASATLGSVGSAGSAVTWTGSLASGASASFSFSVTVHAAPGGDNVVTIAVSSTASGNNCPTGSPDGRCVASVPIARLVISQHYSQPTTTPGSTITLTGTFTNVGAVPYTGITVTSPSADTTDDSIATGDQTASSGTLVLSATAITWTGNIPVGGVVTVTGTLRVTDPDTGNRLVTGTLRSTAPGNNCPAGGTDARCTASVSVLLPGLTISTAASTTVTAPGGSVSYTVSLLNSGQTAYTAANLSIPLAGVLDDAVYNSDAAVTAGSVAYASSTLSWTGPVAVGATVVISYTITIKSTSTGDKTIVTSASSTTVGNTCPVASGNAACHVTVLVLTPALTIVAAASAATATLGSTLAYTVTVTNSGQTSYPAASFADSLGAVLDDASYNADATATSGSASYSAGVVSWTGALTPGATATITYSVHVTNPSTGNRVASDSVVSTTPGSNCASGTADSRCVATVSITNVVSLTLTKTADVDHATAGTVVHYTLTVVNSTAAPVDANLSDPLVGVLDDAIYDANASATVGTASFAGSVVSWSGTVPANGTATVTYTVTVKAVATGNQILNGTISSTALTSSNNCVAGSQDARCTSSVLVASLVIEQHYLEGSTTPGSLLHLTSTFTNTGAYPYTGITIAAPSSGTVDDALATGDETASSGVLALSATAITWSGNIPVGAIVTIAGTLTVQNPDPGDRLITGTLRTTASGANCLTGSTDARCTASIAVLLPALSIAKSASATSVVPGGVVTYTITVRNTGESAYAAAKVSDTLIGVLDDATYDANASATAGVVSYASPVISWTGDLAVGATTTITYSVTAHSPATGDKTMINPVSSTDAGSTCLPASPTPACRSTVVVLTPQLTITSATDSATAVPGAVVAYTVTARNSGQVPFAAAAFTVPLGGVLDDAGYAGGITATSGTVDISGATLTWGGALAPGATATVTYAVTVNAVVSGDFLLTQTVLSSTAGSTCAAGSTDSRCATAVAIASLRLVNVADSTSTTPTGVVSFTGTFTNIGRVAYVGITVSDSFVGTLDDAVYNGDAAADSGSLLLVAGSDKVDWTGDIPIGGSVTITGSVTVNNPPTGDGVVSMKFSSTAAGSNCAAATTDARCQSSVAVLQPALTITTSADVSSAAPGEVVQFTTVATNTGPTAYVGAVIGDSMAGLMGDATYESGSATRGVVQFTSPVLTWTGGLGIGESVTITYSVRVHDPDLGDRSMVNSVSSSALGSSCPTGTAAGCSAEVSVLVPILALSIVADSSTTTPGSSVGYTVTVINAGQIDYSGADVAISLDAALDDATGPIDLTATAGSASASALAVDWTGDIAIGATVIISYSLVVDDPDVGNRLLSSSLSSSSDGVQCGASCSDEVTVLIPGIALSIGADAATTTPGSAVGYTVSITNVGETEYATAVVTIALNGILDDGALTGQLSASAGTVAASAGVLTWTGPLALGATVLVAFDVRVDDPDAGDGSLIAAISSATPGVVCGPSCTVTVAVLDPKLSLSLSASSPTVAPGGIVTYTIVIANDGETDYSGAVVTSALGGVLAEADYNGDAIATGGGVLAYVAPTLSWTGDLPVGASASIRYSVTVHDPDLGDKVLLTRVSSSAAGSTCTNASPCSSMVNVLVPGLQVAITSAASTVVAGDSVAYTVTVHNSGQSDYAPATVVADLAAALDDAQWVNNLTASSGSAQFSASSHTIVWVGALAIGATVTLTYSLTSAFPAMGDLAMASAVTSPSAGASCAASCASIVAVLVPGLLVTKTAAATVVVAGASVQYTITAKNTGAADYPAATLDDSLAAVLDDADYDGNATASVGSLSYSGGTLHWTGALVRDATVTITYSVVAHVAATGDEILTNAVTSTSTGASCTSALQPVSCIATVVVAARSITVSGLLSSFTLTGPPNSTVTVDGAVNMTVTTNSTSGYAVSVWAEGAGLVGALPGNDATIPIGNLAVRSGGSGAFVPLSQTPFTVFTSPRQSAPGGDAVSNDYRVQIPFVPGDVYSTSIDYVVGTQ